MNSEQPLVVQDVPIMTTNQIEQIIKINLSSIIQKQPISNLGVVGNPAHGKSTVVYELSSVKTQKSSAELKRNSTIDLGYANLRIYRNTETNELINSSKELNEPNLILVKHYSFVDCPGHQAYMATMISGSKTFDVSLMLISCSEQIPQPQTVAHSEILKFSKIKNILLLLNKIDLMNNEAIIDTRLDELEHFLDKKENKHFKGKPIVPISAQKKINMDKILEYLVEVPNTNLFESVNSSFQMNVLRSFAINKNNIKINEIKGGVVGGSISSGHISIGDWLVIKPGISEKKNGHWYCTPIIAQVNSIQSGETKLDTAYPGGLIAIGLDCDPSLCRNNNLLGNNVSKFNKSSFESVVKTNNIVTELTIEINYLDFVSAQSAQSVQSAQSAQSEQTTSEINVIDYMNLKTVHFLINGSLIKASISKSTKDPERFDVIVDSPIVWSKGTKIPIVYKMSTGIKLFAIGKMKKAKKLVNVILPDEIDSILTNFTIKENDEIIEIIDDISNLTSEIQKQVVEQVVEQKQVVEQVVEQVVHKQLSYDQIKLNVKSEMMKHKIEKSCYKPSLPTPNFNTECVTKIVWLNAKAYIDEFDLDKCDKLRVEIDTSNIKWCSFGQMIVKQFNYIYNKDTEDIAQLQMDGSLSLSIKRHNIKSVNQTIKNFIMSYFKCSQCDLLTNRFGKVHSVINSICVICNNRTVSEKHFQ